jgi:hypothetical protein
MNMERRFFTVTVVIAILAAFLGEFGKRGLDVMSGFIIGSGWCGQQNGLCLFSYQAGVLILIVLLALGLDSLRNRNHDWTRVAFSVWNPQDSDVLGGIKLSNNSWVDLEDCVAELVRLEDDRYRRMKLPGISDFWLERGTLPKRMYWWDSGDFENNKKIGRGKEGFLAITFPVEDKDQVIPGRKLLYQVRSVGMGFVNMIDSGWFDLRISAYVRGEPLPLKKISVRLEIENDVAVLKEILDAKDKDRRHKREIHTQK